MQILEYLSSDGISFDDNDIVEAAELDFIVKF
jgi:hypothetical protein